MPITRGKESKRKMRAQDDSPSSSKRTKSDNESEFSESDLVNEDHRPICKYGEKCYQKNSYHLSRYRHPHREDSKKQDAVLMKESNRSTISREENESTKNEPDIKAEIETEKDSNVAIEALPASPVDLKENIKQKYLVDMPDDFYSFWDFQKSLSEENSLNTMGIKLVGPFELLDGKRLETRSLPGYLVHWRYYYDPPEFQTVVVADMKTGHHLGYFRDSPQETPAFVGSNVESAGCVITPYGDNLFSAVQHLISGKLKKADPFLKTKLTKLKSQLDDWASENGFSLENQNINKRKKKVVAKTFYQSGIVVPVNKKTNVGYRPVPSSNSELKKLCKKITEANDETERNKYSDELQTLVTYVQYANDEMDYGMGLELGLDLLAYGGEAFHSTIECLLGVAYELLERQEFTTVLKAHLKNRQMVSQADT